MDFYVFPCQKKRQIHHGIGKTFASFLSEFPEASDQRLCFAVLKGEQLGGNSPTNILHDNNLKGISLVSRSISNHRSPIQTLVSSYGSLIPEPKYHALVFSKLDSSPTTNY